MHNSRRDFVKILSGGVVLSALPLVPGCDADMPAEVVRAWRETPPADTEVRRWALAHALLAPNPHNLQPWLVDLSTPDRITLYYDRGRDLPHTDPLYRQLIIGCGAFLELLTLALYERGYQALVTYFPQGDFGDVPDDRPIASVTLVTGAKSRDPLFAHIRQRYTHRMPFDSSRHIPSTTLRSLIDSGVYQSVVAGGSIQEVENSALREIVKQAWEIEVETPRTLMESVRLTRIGGEEIRRHRDGISLTGFMPTMAKWLGWMAPDKVTVPGSSGYQRILEFGQAQARTAMGWLWFTTQGNSRAAQLNAGRAFVRAHLKATELGVAFHPMSQALQEYPEMAGTQASLYRALKLDPRAQVVQMLARIGYASGAQPSPRRELDTMIRT